MNNECLMKNLYTAHIRSLSSRARLHIKSLDIDEVKANPGHERWKNVIEYRSSISVHPLRPAGVVRVYSRQFKIKPEIVILKRGIKIKN